MASYRFEKELYKPWLPELLALPITGDFFDPQCMENDMLPSSVMGMQRLLAAGSLKKTQKSIIPKPLQRPRHKNCIHNLLLLHLGAKMHFISNLNSLIS